MKYFVRCIAFVTWLALSVGTSAQNGSLYTEPLKAETIRVNVRIVEVYATVFNHQQKPVDGLTADKFEVREDGRPQVIDRFESNEGAIACAILIDATGSMEGVMSSVRNSVSRLIDALGPQDMVAIYSFNTRLDTRQPFTMDKGKAKHALLSIRAEGRTALFDAITVAAKDASKAHGKKALIVFTDGADNASALNQASAAKAAAAVGIPVYTIAEGDAVRTSNLKNSLKELSQSTGASSYEVKAGQPIEMVFDAVSKDLKHMYMLTYKPTGAPNDTAWRRISVSVKGESALHVRSKEGYFPN